jgi:hypothetical protein
VIRALAIACRFVLGGIFLYGAATKVPDMAGFAQDVANYRLLPAALVPWSAALVVGIELTVGLALVTGVLTRAAALVAGGMLVVFIGGLAQALLRGIDLKCGCFAGDDAATWVTVARDVAMLTPAVLLLARRPPASGGLGGAAHAGRAEAS